MIRIFENPITENDRLEGDFIFVHEKLNELEQRIDRHEQREETLLRAVQTLLDVIEKVNL